jgi:tellurite resistance protein
MNFTLTIDLGSIDLIGEVPGLGRYDEVLAHAERMRLFSRQFPVLSLDALITAKKATGRAKDMIAAQELEAIRERLKATGQ